MFHSFAVCSQQLQHFIKVWLQYFCMTQQFKKKKGHNSLYAQDMCACNSMTHICGYVPNINVILQRRVAYDMWNIRVRCSFPEGLICAECFIPAVRNIYLKTSAIWCIKGKVWLWNDLSMNNLVLWDAKEDNADGSKYWEQLLLPLL